jgi:hypothetical protein
VLRYAARDPATEGRARRSVVVVVRFAFMRQRVATRRAARQPPQLETHEFQDSGGSVNFMSTHAAVWSLSAS